MSRIQNTSKLQLILGVIFLIALSFSIVAPLASTESSEDLPLAYADENGEVYLGQYFGITREEVVQYLSAYENDSYYLGSPYPTSGNFTRANNMHPNGDPGAGGYLGLNCTGFVAHVFEKCGASLSAIVDQGGPGGEINATNWFKLFTGTSSQSYRYYVYGSVSEMLASGKAQKGDVIYFEPEDWLQPGADCHIGFFWGDSPSENKFWHSKYPLNEIGAIAPKTSPSMLYLVKLSNVGAIDLQKSSAISDITQDNDCYSLEGANYGIYKDAECTQLSDSLTTDSSGYAKSQDLEGGKYYVKEISPPKGYKLDEEIYPVIVQDGKTSRVNNTLVLDIPGSIPGALSLAKRDAETAEFSAQGGGSLAGAEFTFKYWDGYYSDADSAEESGVALRTWVYASDDKGQVHLDKPTLSGDPVFTDKNGNTVLPYGTYVYYESTAPEGYLLPSGTDLQVFVTRIVYDADLVEGEDPHWLPFTRVEGDIFPSIEKLGNSSTIQEEYPVRGGVKIAKYDAELSSQTERVPLGSASLEGAIFSITNENSQPVLVDGEIYEPGEIVSSIISNEDALASTEANTLPYGSYALHESKAPEGYILSDSPIAFSLTQNEAILDLSSRVDSFENQVIRGDFEGIKIQEETHTRMPYVPFLIVSKTTGESHLIVSDKNAEFSTHSSWNPHSQNTNANDAALSIDEEGNYSVEESLLDPEAGVWFGEAKDGSEKVAVNDSLGALPFDEYFIIELPCKANEGHEMIRFSLTIYRNNETIQLGTLTNKRMPKVDIRTSAHSEDGKSVLDSSQPVKLIDTVSYQGLIVGEEYRIEGVLMDKSTADPLLIEGEEVRAETTFVANSTDGNVDVVFEFEAVHLAGSTLVVFEDLYYGDKLLCTHADLQDENQTVYLDKPGKVFARTGVQGITLLLAPLALGTAVFGSYTLFQHKRDRLSRKKSSVHIST